MAYDFLVVGAGFAGSVIAEQLASVGGKQVLLCDKRPHVGGNAYDCYDAAGVLIHKFGPHIFHTNSKDVFEYLSRFTEWWAYEHRVKASVNGKLLPVPINLDTINQLYGWTLNSEELEAYFAKVAEPCETIRTSEDVIVSKVGRELYEKFFKYYTRKQWGLDPSELDATVIARVPVRVNQDDRYFNDNFQAMPKYGYTKMFENMVSHPNITLALGIDYKDLLDKYTAHQIVYTGPVDAFFNHRYGKLPYRSLEFRLETHNQEKFQAAPVINYPNDHTYTRVSEFKQFTGQQHAKTSIMFEYPQAEGDPFYPVPRPENALLYNKYQTLAEQTPNVHFVGRLATYRYYNMDQVVAQALTMASKLSGFSGKKALLAQGS